MKKFTAIIVFLLAAVFFTAAFAEAASIPSPVNGAPVTITCTGSGVNLRADAGKAGKVLTRLSKDQKVYAIETRNTGEDFPWVRVITGDGYNGWFYGQYCEYDETKALSEEGLWEAAYDTSVFFNLDAIKRILGENGKKTPLTEKEREDPYVEGKVVFQSMTVYDTGIDFLSASVTGSDYSVAGLKVGDDMEAVKHFSEMLIKVKGWEKDTDSYISDGTNYWSFSRIVDMSLRPVEGFGIECKAGKVVSISWRYYVID